MTFEAPSFDSKGTRVGLHLRVLATTDLHSHLLPFDYFTDKSAVGTGLACLGEMIAAARQTSPNVLLLDNGDTLQGAPLADAAVNVIVPGGRPHPMIAAMSALGFDAATLGNHDFDFGVPHLEASLAAATFPVVSANTSWTDGTEFVSRSTMLERMVTAENGDRHRLKIGITGALPPQVARWNKPHLQGRLQFGDIVTAVREQVDALRARGADLVVVLAHSGYGVPGAGPMAENVALQVTMLSGVDAVIAGHTHKLRPENAKDEHPQIGAALAQPGAFGSHLGCIDLLLERGGREGAQRWKVAQATTVNVAARKQRLDGANHQRCMLAQYPALRTEITQDHVATRTYVAQPLGKTAVALETYFSTIAPCAATQVVSDAQVAAARPLIAGMPSLAGLRVVSAVAPFKSGGRSGPLSYTDIPAGPLRLRHAADLYLYPNMLSVLRTTGAGIRTWLERAASIYHQIDTLGSGPQSLIDKDFAPYNFDRLEGLTYDVDVSQPARSNAHGDQIFETPGRIRNLRHLCGAPVEASEEILVVTNSYRAAGGGYVEAAAAAEEVIVASFSVRDAVAEFMRKAKPAVRPIVRPNFRLLPLGGISVEFATGPGALDHPRRVSDLSLTPIDRLDEDAFQKFSLRL